MDAKTLKPYGFGLGLSAEKSKKRYCEISDIKAHLILFSENVSAENVISLCLNIVLSMRRILCKIEFICSFLFAGKLDKPLPQELKGLTISSESIFSVLNLLRESYEKTENLEKQLMAKNQISEEARF